MHNLSLSCIYVLCIKVGIFKTRIHKQFSEQNNRLNLFVRIVNSLRLFCSKKMLINIGIKAFCYIYVHTNIITN